MARPEADARPLLLLPRLVPPFGITSRPGDQLDHLNDDSVDVVVIDPPYEANVMYAELSDFFYMIHLSIERLEALG